MRDGTYEILLAGLQGLNTKVTELGTTVAAFVERFDDFQRSVESRYMPRTEVEQMARESQDDRRELKAAMVHRDAYTTGHLELTRRIERLENGPQRLISWIGVGIGCGSLLLTGASILVTAVLWIVLR